MIRLAVMHGRLSAPEDGRIQCFPRASWKDEFARAAEAGVPAIEWIDDTYGADINPLRTDDGIKEIKELLERHRVTVPSVCADSLMEQPFIRCTASERKERLALLTLILRQAKEVGARHVGIPLLDHAALRNTEEIKEAAAAINSVRPVLEDLAMELHLETSLSPSEFPLLLAMLPSPLIRVTYDTGNSASLGFDPTEEFQAYGDRIGSVHIKDRKKGGGTVPLGTGDTDFAAVAQELKEINFRGLFTLQVARGEPGKEVQYVRSCREFAEKTFG